MEFELTAEGTRVRVQDSCEKAHLRGLVGTVMATYRGLNRRAVHVRLDDGRWQLLWAEDLETESSRRQP